MLAGYELLGYHGPHSAVRKGEGLEDKRLRFHVILLVAVSYIMYLK